MRTLGQCFVFAGSLIPFASIYPIVQSKNIEKKTVSDYVQIKTFIIPLSSTYTPLASSSSHQGFGVTWASLGLSFIVGLSGYGTANGKKVIGV